MSIPSQSPLVFPPEHPLAGCEAKYRRSFEHFNMLQEEIRSHYGAGKVDFVTTRGELVPDTKNYFRHVVATVDHPPVRWATVVGDIIHNLRSILDILVYELAFLGTGGPPTKNVSFPVCHTRAAWDSSNIQKGKLTGVLPVHKAMLYRLQPCYRRKRASVTPKTIEYRKPHPFADLHDLWNDDKHRLLELVLLAPLKSRVEVVTWQDCEVAGSLILNRRFFGRPFDADAEIARIRIKPTGLNPYVTMKFQLDCDVCLRDGVPICDRLAGIAQWVMKAVEWMAPEFETPAAKRLWGLERGSRVKTAPLPRRRRAWVKIGQ